MSEVKENRFCDVDFTYIKITPKNIVKKDIALTPQCFRCKHFDGNPEFTCDAYPEGIPDEILINKTDHSKPHKGDNGIRFEEEQL